MIRGTEAGARIRAAIVDMKGQLNMADWEGPSANVMGHVWITDCDSLYEHLISTKHNSVDNKRLNVDLMALRQLVWERGGERQEYVDHSRGDFPRWIDTSTMIADPLTKAMSCERLSNMLSTGILDLNPTQESLIIKAKNKLLRKKTKEAKKVKDENADADNEDIDLNIAWRSDEDSGDDTSKDKHKDKHEDKPDSKKEKRKEEIAELFKAMLRSLPEMELGELRARQIEKENAKKRAKDMKELEKKEDSDTAKKDDMNMQKGKRNGNCRFQ